MTVAPISVLTQPLLERCRDRAAGYDRDNRFCQEDFDDLKAAGYLFTGRKSFGSRAPVGTRLGMHGMDTSNPSAPKIVHAFLPRDAKGYSIKETWDVLGMRATRSDDTVLEGAFVPNQYIGRIVPAGAAGIDMFVPGFFTWALVGLANFYYGLSP